MKNVTLCILSVFFLSGCIAAINPTPVDCPQSTSRYLAWVTTGIKDGESNEPFVSQDKMPTKNDYLAGRGSPGEIIQVDENQEIWVYEKSIWCGTFLLFFIIPAPLILPVCDGVDRITFENETAKLVEITGQERHGFIIAAGGGDSWGEIGRFGDNCRGYWQDE